MMYSCRKKGLTKQIMACMAIMLMSRPTFAANIDAEILVLSCQELVAIYNRKGEKQLLAGISTSVAEAMRAGICRGMLEEHGRHDHGCNIGWYEGALTIAQSNYDDKQSVEKLLKNACR